MIGIVIPPPAQPGGDPITWINGLVLAILALAVIVVPLIVFWVRDRSSRKAEQVQELEPEVHAKAA